jgi:20S proteasome subunit beta 7
MVVVASALLKPSSSSSSTPRHHRQSKAALLVSLLLQLQVFIFSIFTMFPIAASSRFGVGPTSADGRSSAAAAAGPTQRTTYPMMTGTSTVGIMYNGGILLASDTLLSYGSLAKVSNAQRLAIIPSESSSKGGSAVVLGASGEFSDFQALVDLLEEKALEEGTTSLMDSLYKDDDNVGGSTSMTAESTWNYLRMVLYSRRNKMDPYWNELIVAGAAADGKTPFLGTVDKIGTAIGGTATSGNKTPYAVTGMGAYLAMPLLREKWRPDLTEGEARALLEDCMRVLFYRDARASSKVILAKWTTPTAASPTPTALISEPYQLETQWNASSFQTLTAHLEGDGGF